MTDTAAPLSSCWASQGDNRQCELLLVRQNQTREQILGHTEQAVLLCFMKSAKCFKMFSLSVRNVTH